ncbi:MAG TPA: adenylyltransferase/cytidyltransferase family protein [Candidatus Paceibacterota bacterium]|jgi:D-beta-D-heptose 7-phosphate kinase/D-beta-D-heptose 1-phosphate adenosyltransferase|nr:adenylyltransferase/cytidyltransferase family protein [Candidatus Paceibacterota bacterium]
MKEQERKLRGTERRYVKTEKDPNKTRILTIVGSEVAFEERLINDREQLQWVVNVLKQEGLKIVYTSGVYDLIHIGHLMYLDQARSLGHVVIIGVDSDELTRERKSDIPGRPIVPLKERLKTLAYARTGHIYTVRDTNEHKDQLIVDILPDIALFSRSTKDEENFEEKIVKKLSDYCGEIVFLDPQADVSTTERIRNLHISGADGLGKAVTETIENYLNPNKEAKK